MSDRSLVRFRAVVEGALAHLESRRQEINDLNVFPVADGDTGDNMALTLRACLKELDDLAREEDGRLIDEIGRTEITERVARAALLGARGNSGVILSQLVRGAAEELISRPGELVDPVLISAAMAQAAQRAYDSVREPVEGTMLTVMREMAARVATDLAHMPETRLGSDWNPEKQNALIADVLERAIVAGEESVRRGPELLPALKEAGVVDAGGYAVTVIFAGVVAVLRGSDAPRLAHHVAPARVTHPEHESSTYRYCTNFAVTGSDLDSQHFAPLLEQIGDSVLVVGDAVTLRVHVHTDDPEQATALFDGHGDVVRLDVADMRAQVVERDERLAASDGGLDLTGGPAGQVAVRCGVLAVVAGDGMRELFAGYDIHTLDGGQTMNPSTMELLAGIHAIPAEEVVVLPNSANVIMAAERAAELAEKHVRVVPSRSLQAGLATVLAVENHHSADDNAAAMQEALEDLRTGAVAPAARKDPEGRFAIGDAVGFVDDQLVAWGDPQETLRVVLAQLDEGAELITCIAGDGAPLDAAGVEALAPHPENLEQLVGGQPSYWWLLSAE